MYGAITSFQNTPVDAQRLSDAKKRRTYGFLMNLDTPNKVAGNVARTIAITGGTDAVNDFYTAIDGVTPEDIMEAARHYFAPERRTVVVLKGARQ
jgi:zinc protease